MFEEIFVVDLAVFDHNHEHEFSFFTSKKFNYGNNFTLNFSKFYNCDKIHNKIRILWLAVLIAFVDHDIRLYSEPNQIDIFIILCAGQIVLSDMGKRKNR